MTLSVAAHSSRLRRDIAYFFPALVHFEVRSMLRLSSRRRAGAAAEFAVLLPFLIFLAVIGTDWARLFYYTISIESCARTGVLLSLIHI